MMSSGYLGLVLIGVWLSTTQKSDAVSVKPSLCPTNKIAPHRRIANWDTRPRTFGHFSGLLAGNDLQYDSPSSLQEEPQEDDPEDCGDIEDYDEHDLSSITPTGQRRGSSGFVENRLFFGQNNYERPPYRPPQNGNPTGPQYGNPSRPPQNGGYLPNRPTRPPQQYPTRPPQQYPTRPPQQYPTRPPQQYPTRPPQYENPIRPTRPPQQYPTRPPRPYPPTRPPYSSGGFFSGNQYRPPYQQNPSDNVKPVYEGAYEQSATYRPGVVGGPSGHVVGVPVRPTRPQYDEDQTTTPSYPIYDRPQQPQNSEYPTRRERPRRLNNESVLGSFFDLLFK